MSLKKGISFISAHRKTLFEQLNIGSVEMFKKLERSWGFHPRHFAPPRCDNPREGNNSTIALRRGGPGGQALSPPSKRLSFFILCYNIRNSTEPLFPFMIAFFAIHVRVFWGYYATPQYNFPSFTIFKHPGGRIPVLYWNYIVSRFAFRTFSWFFHFSSRFSDFSPILKVIIHSYADKFWQLEPGEKQTFFRREGAYLCPLLDIYQQREYERLENTYKRDGQIMPR